MTHRATADDLGHHARMPVHGAIGSLPRHASAIVGVALVVLCDRTRA